MWEGQRTYLRNFGEFAKVLRRPPLKILQYLSKEFAVPAEKIGDKAMFIGKREPDDFARLFKIYLREYVKCPTCKSPDTGTVKENRISFLICEGVRGQVHLEGQVRVMFSARVSSYAGPRYAEHMRTPICWGPGAVRGGFLGEDQPRVLRRQDDGQPGGREDAGVLFDNKHGRQ